MKKNGRNGSTLRELAKEMNARFDSMSSEFQKEFRGLRSDMDTRFGRIEKRFRKDVSGLKKSTNGLLEYVQHLDEEFQKHRHDRGAHFPPAR